jgi:hypothetical protein
MGYLTQQLEKKALDLSQIARMTAGAANSGKLPHFLKRIAQRNNAIRNVSRARQLKFDNAIKGPWNEEKILAAQPLAKRIPGHGSRLSLNSIDPGATAGVLTAKDVLALGHHGGAAKMPLVRHADVGMSMNKVPHAVSLGQGRFGNPIVVNKLKNTLQWLS